MRALRVYVRTFGPRPKYVFLLLFRLMVLSSAAVFLPLDRWLLRPPPLERPVFLLGHLRSGTTFLHRFLLGAGTGLTGLRMLEMLLPSRLQRALLAPLLPLLRRVSLNGVWDPSIHETGLFEAETDDIAVMLRFSDGLLGWIYTDAFGPALDEEEARAGIEAACGKPGYLHLLDGLARGVLAGANARLLSKSFFGLFLVDGQRARTPDARYLLLVRDPKEVVPSTLSMQRSVQGSLHGLQHDSPLARRYYRNLYQAALVYHRRFVEVADRLTVEGVGLVVTHRALREDFAGTMQTIAAFLGLPDDPAFSSRLAAQAARQSEHRSEHGYALAEFGLDEATIERDFAFLYARFDL